MTLFEVRGLSKSFGGLHAVRGVTFKVMPGDRKAIYLGKLMANVAIMLVMELCVVPIAGILYSLDLWARLPGLAGVALLHQGHHPADDLRIVQSAGRLYEMAPRFPQRSCRCCLAAATRWLQRESDCEFAAGAGRAVHYDIATVCLGNMLY